MLIVELLIRPSKLLPESFAGILELPDSFPVTLSAIGQTFDLSAKTGVD
jgi:hypothetical protein